MTSSDDMLYCYLLDIVSHLHPLSHRCQLSFNSHFQIYLVYSEPKCLQSWCYWELRMMAVVVTTGAVRCAKLQSDHHHWQTSTQLFWKYACVTNYILVYTYPLYSSFCGWVSRCPGIGTGRLEASLTWRFKWRQCSVYTSTVPFRLSASHHPVNASFLPLLKLLSWSLL